MKLDANKSDRLINGDLTESDLVWLKADQDPFSLHGVFFDEKAGCYLRMPAETGKNTSPQVNRLNQDTAGGRLRFCTDSQVIAIAVKLHKLPNRPQMAPAGISGWDLYRKDSDREVRFHQALIPPTPTCDRYERMSRTDGTMTEYTLHFPLYCGVKSLYIGLKKGSELTAPSPYPNDFPVVFYGSSITQGSSASRPGITYEGYLSRWLNFDYVNLGFSGACKAEPTMAEYFENLSMKAFVYDFDHNVSTSAELEEKHLSFYRRVRNAHPDLPILFLSAPDVMLHQGDFLIRREIVRRNFERAQAEGDRNLWYIDGATLFGKEDHLDCTIDGTHPNDLGFYRMASAIRPTLKEMLKK